MELRTQERQSTPETSLEEVSRLVGLAREGDSEAFGAIFELLSSKLHRQAFFLTGDEHQAVELLQETMVEVWKHLRRYDARTRFFTWVCSVMVHRHYDWRRRWRARAAALLRAETAVEESWAPSPLETTGQMETARLLRECLEDLPAKQRAVVFLRFYAGESLEGIAAIAQCTVGTVKSRLFNGLERLAKMRKLKEFRGNLPTEARK